MAIAKKCDVCGKFHEPYGQGRSIVIEPVVSYIKPNSIDLGFSYDYYSADVLSRLNMDVSDHYDLCPECLEKILNFIESLKGEKK